MEATSFTLTEREFVAARRLHIRKRRLIFLAVMVVVVVCLVAMQHPSPPKFIFMTSAILLGGAIGGSLGAKFDDWRFLREFRQNEEFRSQMSISLSHGELMLSTDKSTSSIPRSRILMVRSNDHVTLLYRSSAFFHIVPTRGVTPEIAEFLKPTLGKP